MRALITYAFLCALPIAASAQPNVYTVDIDHFWQAYDSARTTTDTTLQCDYFQRLYVDRGTVGLHAFMDARDLTAKRWYKTVNKSPKFWVAIRPNTLQVKNHVAELEAAIGKLKAIYPSMRPSKMYFTIGCLTSGGTTQSDMVLIGSEIAAADSNIDASELSKWLQGVFRTQSLANIVTLNVHEYVHTQQQQEERHNLLAECLQEGAADFIAEVATGVRNHSPYMIYGRAHEAELKADFKLEMYGTKADKWLYNGSNAEHADLGYFMGYSICSAYYRQASDKVQAVKDIIELKAGDNAAVNAFLTRSGYY